MSPAYSASTNLTPEEPAASGEEQSMNTSPDDDEAAASLSARGVKTASVAAREDRSERERAGKGGRPSPS